MRTSIESDPTNPASQTDPQWAAQFNRLLFGLSQAMNNGKSAAQFAEPAQPDPTQLADAELCSKCEEAFDRTFKTKKSGELWHVINSTPQYSSFQANGFNFVARLFVQRFVYEPLPGGTKSERRRKPLEERFVDAREFFAAHTLIETHEDKSWREFCASQPE